MEPSPFPMRTSTGTSSEDDSSSNNNKSISSSSNNRAATTKSYALGSSLSSRGGGVPIFVGSGAHSHAHARGTSMGPPLVAPSRRSQTPQATASPRISAPLEEPVQAPPFWTRHHDGQGDAPAEVGQEVLIPGRKRRMEPENNLRRSRRNVADGKDASSVHAPVDYSATRDAGGDEGEDGHKTRKDKGKAVPQRPTKPLSAYVLFSRETRPRISEAAGTADGASFNITAKVREEWKNLPLDERAHYESEAALKKEVWQSNMEDWLAKYSESQASHPTTTLSRTRRSMSRKVEPAPPSKDAYQLFQDDRPGDESAEKRREAWQSLSGEERAEYENRVREAERQYATEKQLWDEENEVEVKRKRTKEKKKTASEDEAGYLAEVEQYGAHLRARRLDPRKTAMADLSLPAFKQGRASRRTFDMQRKLENVKRERKKQLKVHRAAVVSGRTADEGQRRREKGEKEEEEEEDDDEDEAERGGPAGEGRQPSSRTNSDGEEREEDEADGGGSDADSAGATSVASSHHHPLRENRFTVQTRIVNGQIVLDESSLQQQRSLDASMDGLGAEYLDINENDRFVNSATYSKRVGTERWDAQETRRFLQAVSMWGSDFEMIARMFPNRNRKQIRSKWRSLERTDSRSLDLAFKRKLPVDLEEYGLLAGVDLSGEAPRIEASLLSRKLEELQEGEDREEEERAKGLAVDPTREIERNEYGHEIIEEGRPAEATKVVRKKSATPIRVAASEIPSGAARDEQGDGDDDDDDDDETNDLPATKEDIMKDAKRRNERAVSASSTTSHHRPRSGSVSKSNSTETERLRAEKKKRELERKERERSRRRHVPRNEEEVVEE
ncbi:hypothetical protein CBS101457_000380 [Exobasidium rhododendri]|nr:hypothetical protein CBS101457_000380 [Exobasidium rhododendri]